MLWLVAWDTRLLEKQTPPTQERFAELLCDHDGRYISGQHPR